MRARIQAVILCMFFACTLCAANAWPDKGGDDKRLTLWRFVHDECVPHQRAGEAPTPCIEVNVVDEEKGYAVFPDRNGVAQFLLIPTRRITGIESPIILEPDLPDYWQAAWQARLYIFQRLQKELPREDIGLAINSEGSRSQDQLHIHIDCVAPEVDQTLQLHSDEIGQNWKTLDFDLIGKKYNAMRVNTEDLAGINPFSLAAEGLHLHQRDMAKETLVMIGATFKDDQKGFILLEDRANKSRFDLGRGEDLLDPSCKIAQSSIL